MNSKYYIILLLSYLGFVGSWYISFLLASTLAATDLDFVLAFIITTVMQASSFYFFTKRQMGIAILLFSISILGTVCYQYNIHNDILNESWNKSESYNIALQNRELRQNNITKTTKLFDTGVSALESQIEDLKRSKEKNSKNKHIGAWQRNENEKQYNKEISNLTTQISNLVTSSTNTLKTESDALQGISLDRDNTKINLQSKGYLGLAQNLSENTGVKETTIILFIQVLIAITFEVTAIKLHIAAQKERKGVKYEKNNRERSKGKSTNNNSSNGGSNRKTISDNIDELELRKFRTALEQNADKSGKCKGYNKIAEEAGIKGAKKLYNKLKEMKVIDVIDGHTTILKYQKGA